MRAQTVNFERGQDPKDALSIGNRNARNFKKALKNRDYLGRYLETMINGLTEGSIPEKDAINFIEGAIMEFHAKRHILWKDWYFENGFSFWGSDIDKFIITFDLPEDSDHWGFLKIRSEIYESESGLAGKIFEIDTVLQSEKVGEEAIEEHFHQNNVFPPGDHSFHMKFVIKQISEVVEATIKNMG